MLQYAQKHKVNYFKIMEQYGFKSMSVDFGKAQNPVQHDPILMIRLLSDNTALFETSICAMFE